MKIQEIEAKSILRRQKKIDSWFLTHYGMNLYRGCTHNCVYCDGQSEKYRVEGTFGSTVEVKTNAIELLQKELNPSRKRKPMPKSFVMLGGGVCDAYQPAEEKYKLARKTLELIAEYRYPVHILTKSTLVERDLDLLQTINQQTKALVSFSLSSANDQFSQIFEPGVPSPSDRLASMQKLKNAGIPCGLFLMPVIPFLSDSTEEIKNTLHKACKLGAEYAIFGTMTLKEGRQKDHFMNVLEHHFPELPHQYDMIYPKGNEWGNSTNTYSHSAHETFNLIASTYQLPKRIPPSIYQDLISKHDLVIVILEHLDYLLKLKNQKSKIFFLKFSKCLP